MWYRSVVVGKWIRESPLSQFMGTAGLAALVIAACSLQSGQTYQAAAVTFDMQAAPGDILSLVLTVTGPDMDPLTLVAEPNAERITINVPAGTSRPPRSLVGPHPGCWGSEERGLPCRRLLCAL